MLTESSFVESVRAATYLQDDAAAGASTLANI
jgi:hypothetical protein